MTIRRGIGGNVMTQANQIYRLFYEMNGAALELRQVVGRQHRGWKCHSLATKKPYPRRRYDSRYLETKLTISSGDEGFGRKSVKPEP